MNNILLDSLPIWTTAQAQKTSNRGISASNQQLLGIKKLRELILELAVRGKLVSQDPNDEPASELLKKIVEENKKKIKNEKKKDVESFREINENEKILNLPVGWAWVRFGNIALIERGGSPRPIESYLTQDPDGYNWIKISDTEIGGKYITSTREKIRKEGLVKTRMVYPGDFLLTNSMSFGRPYISKIEGCIHDGWLRIHPPIELNKDYLYSLLSSPYVSTFFKIAAAGAVVLNLNADKVRELPIPLPPLAEQHRIVERVNELMALCDELEKEQTNSNTVHETLVEVLLSTLTDAKNSNDFKEAWQRVAGCFDTLFTTEHSIDKLKQTILQLAVMGKLVPQNPNDEPASVLLKKIAAEKARLLKEGKIKIEKNLPPITDEELHYQLPDNWIWCRMQDLCPNISSGSTPENRFFIDSGIPYLKVYNIRNQKIDFSFKEQFVSHDINSTKLKRSILNPGDVIMNIVGPPLGKVAIIPNDYDEWNCNQAIVFFKPVIREFNQWLYTFLCTGTFLNDIELIGTAGQDNISVTKSKNIVIPLPPLSEQLRIVSKVEELFALCDSLKERIREAQELQNVLAEEIVRRVVN